MVGIKSKQQRHLNDMTIHELCVYHIHVNNDLVQMKYMKWRTKMVH